MRYVYIIMEQDLDTLNIQPLCAYDDAIKAEAALEALRYKDNFYYILPLQLI